MSPRRLLFLAAATLLACRAGAQSPPGGTQVRGASVKTPVAGATILGEWLEITYKAREATPKIPGVTAKSSDQGWFVLCGLPKAGIIGLTVSRDADSSGLVELDVPPERILRRD